MVYTKIVITTAPTVFSQHSTTSETMKTLPHINHSSNKTFIFISRVFSSTPVLHIHYLNTEAATLVKY